MTATTSSASRSASTQAYSFHLEAAATYPALVALASTAPAHLGGTLAPTPAFAEQRDDNATEAMPNANAVDLEEQMAKLSEVGTAHRLASQLYRKYAGMVRLVAASRG